MKGILICINRRFSTHFPGNVISNTTGDGVIRHLDSCVSVLASPLEDDPRKSWLFAYHKMALDKIRTPDIPGVCQ